MATKISLPTKAYYAALVVNDNVPTKYVVRELMIYHVSDMNYTHDNYWQAWAHALRLNKELERKYGCKIV